MDRKVVRILNFGAGTQSSVLLLMADRGEIAPVDVAIFADTRWETQAVYDHLEWIKTQLTQIQLVILSAGNIKEDALVSQVKNEKGKFGRGRWGSMPLFVRNQKTGKRGMIRRQCTSEYKIEPIERYIKSEVLGLKRRARWPKSHCVTQIYGISVDEMERMRTSQRACIVNEYPLVSMRWHRSRAVEWAERHYPDRIFPRSACVGCPFHSDYEWAALKRDSPSEFAEAVEVDEALRNASGMRGQVYLHSSLIPLSEVDFRSRDDMSGQGILWQDECHGVCGV